MSKQKQEEIIVKNEIIKGSIQDDQTRVATQWLNTLQHNSPEDPATNIAKLLLACVAKGDFKTSSALTKEEGLTAPSNTLTTVDYLSHASRIIIDYKSLSEEHLKEFLSIFPKAGEDGVFSRSATHGVVRKGDAVKELKGFMLGLVGQLPELVKYAYDFGVNIAMGGEGQKNYVGNKISKNGFSGHMYFHHYFPDQLMMVGLEQSAPAGSILEAVMGHSEHDHEAQAYTDQFGQGHSLTGASDTFTAAGSLYFSDPVYQAKLLCETGTTPPDKYGAMQVTLNDENWELIKGYLLELNNNLADEAYGKVLKKLVTPPSTATEEPQVVKSYIALDFKTYLKNIRPLLLEAEESVQTQLITEQSRLEKQLLACIESLRIGYNTKTYKEFVETLDAMNQVEDTPTDYCKALLRIKHLFNLQCKIDPKLEQTRTDVLVTQQCNEIIESVQKLTERASILKDYYSSLSANEPVKLLNELLFRLKNINSAVTMGVTSGELTLESSLLLQGEMENSWIKLDTFNLEDLIEYQKSLQEIELFLQEASSTVPSSVFEEHIKVRDLQAKQTLLMDFIAAVEQYWEQRDEQPEISMFNFWSWSKQMKKASYTGLVDVLQSLVEGKDITLDQKQKLEECAPCIANGKFGKTVQDHLLRLGMSKVTDLVEPAIKITELSENVSESVNEGEDDLFTVELIDGKDLGTNVIVGLVDKDEPKHVVMQKQIKMQVNEIREEEEIRKDLKVQ